jgi:hypothetical protein
MSRSLKMVAVLLCIGPFASARADEALIRQFLPGLETNSVGLVEASEDTEMDGPQAIYTDEKGDLYLLDQVNGRVLKFDPKDPTKVPQALQLPHEIQPTDIVVANDIVYVWDGKVIPLQATGAETAPTRSLTLSRSIDNPDEYTLSAFASMGSQSIEPSDDAASLSRGLDSPRGRSPQFIASHGRAQVSATFSAFGGDSGVQIELRQKSTGASLNKLKLQVRGKLGSVDVLDIDKAGRTFVLAENIPADSADQAAAFVARFSAAGVLEGVYELPLSNSVILTRRYVSVSPDGDVYFLRSQKGTVDVLGVGFRLIKNSGIVETAASKASLSDYAKKKGASAAVRPLSRQQVIETANAFANVRWRVNPGAYGHDPDTTCSGFNRVRRPGYLHGRLNTDVQGIPYCWGCHGTLPQIATEIEKGTLAGNVCTRDDPRRDTAGVDCSAFVSAAWGLARHFTTIAIPAIAKQLENPWDLLPGDALNKPGSHVMLFLRFTPDRKVEVMESSTVGCNGRVCRNIYPLASLLARGYDPVRYRGLAGEAVAQDPNHSAH